MPTVISPPRPVHLLSVSTISVMSKREKKSVHQKASTLCHEIGHPTQAALQFTGRMMALATVRLAE
jgi:hypothetical protein